MFAPSRFTGLFLVFAVLLFTVAVGCQNQTDSGSNSEATGKTKQVTVEVTGMSCAQGCAPRAKDALATLPWAKNVQVDFDKKQATFVADTASYDETAIIATLEKEGFGGTVVK